MAYMSQENKQSKAQAIKDILNWYGLKGSLSVRNHSTLVLNLKSGAIDFIGNLNRVCSSNWCKREQFQPVTNGHIQVNPYWFHEHFDGKAKSCLAELLEAMNVGNHDNSEPQVDHFDVGWYVDINIGKWNKPYICTTKG